MKISGRRKREKMRGKKKRGKKKEKLEVKKIAK